MTAVDDWTSGAPVLVLLFTVLLLTPPNEAVVHPGTGSTRWFLRVAVMGMWDGAAASNDEEEGAQDEDLKRTTLPASGIGRIENGAADVTHGARMPLTPRERNRACALRVHALDATRATCGPGPATQRR